MKTITFAFILCLACFAASGQTSTPAAPAAPLAFVTTDKVLKDTVIKDVSYKLYVGKKGGRYIIRTAKVSGKTYKQYFKPKK